MIFSDVHKPFERCKRWKRLKFKIFQRVESISSVKNGVSVESDISVSSVQSVETVISVERVQPVQLPSLGLKITWFWLRFYCQRFCLL